MSSLGFVKSDYSQVNTINSQTLLDEHQSAKWNSKVWAPARPPTKFFFFKKNKTTLCNTCPSTEVQIFINNYGGTYIRLCWQCF